jgi:hypothetical protein
MNSQSTMNSQVLQKFNYILEEFIVKMSNAFPDEQKLKTYYNAFKISKMYNNQLPLKIFMGGCLGFADQIKSRDAEFFMNRPQFVDKCVRVSSFSDDIGLRERWETTPDTTKNSIWDYVITLFILGETYINKDADLLNNINKVYNSMSLSEMKRFEDGTVTEFSDDFKKKID